MSEYLLTDAARATEEYEQFLSGIHDEWWSMSDTVNDLLEAARLNSGRGAVELGDVPARRGCRDALDSHPPAASTRTRVRLSARGPPRSPP
jgi:signal transduction histidine kinase